MDNPIIIIVALLLALAALIHAYTMGWQAGHDVHHDDSQHGRDSKPRVPPTDTPLWR